VGEELKTLLKGGTKVERDALFMMKPDLPEPVLKIPLTSERLDPEVRGLPSIPPERALGLLEALSPPTLVFHRQVNTSRNAVKRIEGAMQNAPGLPIYGSVTTADIILALKDSINHNVEASTILLQEDMVSIKNNDEARIKALGTYEASIRLNDDNVLTKRLEVRPIVTTESSIPSKSSTASSLETS